MSRNWARLGALLRADRQAGGRTQDEMGAELGVTRNALGSIEAGNAKRVTSTIRSYARAVGWADGSVEQVLAGGDPDRVDTNTPTDRPKDSAEAASDRAARAIADVLLARLPQRVLQELADGHIVDTDVLDLRPDGSVALMTLVVERGGELPPADQVRDDLRRWSTVQRGLRRSVQDQQDSGADSSE
ncbi:helix-turn-helix domain-containing protein [Kitasatospora sp. NPDC058046]|uniref:helix-turn-helix domain-containing protein n=1 Tax=Kitasatospora sp. NPDC058046 TaxID=3346312 RepID=UPI0036D8E363